MSVYRRFPLFSAIFGFAMIVTLLIFGVWHPWFHQESVCESPSIPAIALLLGAVGSVWAIAPILYLRQRTTMVHALNRQLHHEIAQRKLIEQDLRESEERWQLALRGNNDGIWDWNVQTNDVFFSSRWKKMLGFADHEIANHLDEWSKRVHPDDLQGVLQAIQDHFAKKTPFYITEHRMLCKDGSYKWILDRGQALWDDAGQVTRMTGSHTDITEKKQSEVGLRESEERYRRLIQNLNAGFVVYGTAAQLLMCNQIACDLLGFSIDHLEKSDHDFTWNFMDEDGLPMPPERYPVNQVLATQTPLKNVVLGIQQEKETPRWVLANAFPEFDCNHQLMQVVVTFIDISERKRVELERQQAKIALRQSEATNQAIIDAIPDLLIRMRSDGSYVDFMSKNGLDHLYPNQISVDTALSKILPPDLAKLRLDSIQQALQSQEPQIYEHEVFLGGQQRHEEVRVVPLPQDDVLVMVRDITARKKAEAELKNQKNFLQQVIDAVPSSIFVKDQQGKFLIVNQAASSIYGIPIDEMLGKRDSDFNENLLQSKEFITQNESVIQNLTPITFPDQEIEDRYGTIRWYQTTISPFINAVGQVNGIIGNAIEVSDRKRAEINLQLSEERLKLALDASQDGLWDWNVQTGHIFHSDRYLEILGYQPGELTLSLNAWKATIHPNDQPAVMKCLTAHLQDSSHAYACDYRVRCKSGEWKWIADYGKVVVRGAHGKPLRMVGAYRDISDRKRAEAELRHQKEIFQAIVNHIPLMIVLFNGEGQVELVNPAMEKVLGWSLTDWQQLDQSHPDSLPDAYHQLRNHRLAASGKWYDFTIQTAFGQTLDISWANVQLSNGHSLSIGQDVSDRKRRELALHQAVEAAEAANLAKSLFLANMSHELRTPLNVILGFAQVMTHDPSLTLHQQADLQTIRRSGDHLLNLINDVLDLSKIEAGYSTVDLGEFDLIALLHSLRTMFSERATVKGLLLFFDIAPEVPQFILSDIQKLRQILLNLLSNAIKFTERGSVTVQVRVEEWGSGGVEQGNGGAGESTLAPLLPSCPPAPLPPSSLAPLTLQFAIADTGPGIAEEELETIFDAFIQAKAGRQSASGTGLGLTISRKLLELMGGRIAVNSVLGHGSSFTLSLPVQPCSGISVASEPSDRIIIGLAPGQRHRRILVVDDQLENRKLLMRLLFQPGLEVREASNGEDAIYLWQEWQPDLVWMDIRMPGMNGYEATRQIRALEQGNASIIIALTAQASQSDRTLALVAGCDDYISKPFREETLFLKMKEYLGLEYVYAEPDIAVLPSPKASPCPDESYAALLATLPTAWLEAMEEAAVCGNDRAIAELAAQLPSHATELASFLLELADQFAFEHILHLIHQPFEHR